MPSSTSASTTRKRTRSTNISDYSTDRLHHQPSSSNNVTTTTATSITNAVRPTQRAMTANAPPKRPRNNPPPPTGPPPVAPRTRYSLRNRSLTPDPRRTSTRFPSLNGTLLRSPNRQRYNLRPRHPQSQVRLPQVSTTQPTVPPRRSRPLIPPITQVTPSSSTDTNHTASLNFFSSSSSHLSIPVPVPVTPPLPVPPPISVPPVVPPITRSIPPAIQPRQYRLVYISDDDDEQHPTATIVNTTIDIVTDDEDDELLRSRMTTRRRSFRSMPTGASHNTRSRATTVAPSSATSVSSSGSSSDSTISSIATINTQDLANGIAYIRLNRAIEIVIDSIQSLEGAVNSFDQLVFGLIYNRLGTGDDAESIESMIRLSRILNLNLPSRLTQDEIDALPKINFINKMDQTSSLHLVEKCPICLTEFNDQETINKLYCTHLFHQQCISTWLSENDSCPTCRRKVMTE